MRGACCTRFCLFTACYWFQPLPTPPLMIPRPCRSMFPSRCRRQALRPPVAFVVAEVKGLVLDAHILAGKWFAQPTLKKTWRPYFFQFPLLLVPLTAASPSEHRYSISTHDMVAARPRVCLRSWLHVAPILGTWPALFAASYVSFVQAVPPPTVQSLSHVHLLPANASQGVMICRRIVL